MTRPALDTQPLLLCCWSRSSTELSEPTLHLADHPAHCCTVCSSRGHLPLPVDPAVSNHQRQGTRATPKTLFAESFAWPRDAQTILSCCSLPGDVQSETGQGHASTATAPHAHTPHQLPSLGLCILPRPGLRRPGDIRTLPAPTRSDQQDFGSAALGSRHHGFQSNGPLGRVQPHGSAAECQSCRRRGHVAADVQDLLRLSAVTVRWGFHSQTPAGAFRRNCF